MSTRLALPRPSSTHHTRNQISGQSTLYHSVHDVEQAADILLRVKGPNRSSELIGLCDVIARLMRLVLE